MRKLLFALLFCFTPLAVSAVPLKVVNVSAPAINCVFNTPCTIMVNDKKDNVTLSAGGTGFLQSRTFKGFPGSPANGLFAYEYRLDLRNAVGALNIACIDWITISFGPVISTLDYDGVRGRRSGKRRQQFFLGSGFQSASKRHHRNTSRTRRCDTYG